MDTKLNEPFMLGYNENDPYISTKNVPLMLRWDQD